MHERCMNDLENLKAKIDGLSPTAIRFVTRMVDSVSSPPKALTGEVATWLSGTPEWIEYFGLALSVHHGATAEPLGLTGFESVFRNACEAVDWVISKSESATQRFLDLALDDGKGRERRLSLKSTAAQRLSNTTVHISKLTEAAWIQDVRTARTRRARTLQLFRDYTEAVDSIVMLRAFRRPNAVPHRYQLLEIPTEIFKSLQDSSLNAFASDGPTVDCSYRGHSVAARVYLDRSDAKITVKQVLLAACTVHAEWVLQNE